MTRYIMKYGDHLAYIDTDGIKLTCDLPSYEVGNKLGEMKFEGEFDEAVFIAPKVYGGITSGEILSKVKGYSSMVLF